MQTGGISNAMYNLMQTNVFNRNGSSNSTLNLLRRQKIQIQEQINKIEESKLPSEIKDEKIKVLQEQLKEIEKQIIEEQTKKLTEDIELKKYRAEGRR